MTPDYKRALDHKYEIIRQIKQGGFGIVYYGIDKKLNKPVAIKEIAPNLLADPKYLDMFEEEALNIAKLSHNNIVHIYELKKTPDRHLFIIMEYIDGIDLEKIIRTSKKSGRKVPPHLTVYIIAEICMALEYAHQRRDAFTNKPLNLVHQDISPSNIMISREGVVKLIDFGIASVRRHQNERKDNKLRGKIPYMAPEQLIMGNHPDHRSDIFSLGLVLFEVITGTRLFNSQEEVLAAGKNPKWFRKALKGKKIPSTLGKILHKALEIDLSRRYQTANHMYIDLLHYLIACNETGELMDDLADYLAEQFDQSRPQITPPTYDYSEGTFLQPNPTHSPTDPGHPNYDISTNEPGPGYLPSDRNNKSRQTTGGRPASEVPPEFARHESRQQRRSANYGTMEFEADGEEDLKTVIDVIRISAKNYKKRVIQAGVGLVLAVLTFGTFDTINGWTKTGVWIYDQLFPPAIEIVTIPANAHISLDNQPLDGTTPLSINKISPGVHKLELAHAGYKPIVKSLFVPREGFVKVQGQDENNSSHSYLFRFSVNISIDSAPQGADIYINGVRFNQRTPSQITWEVGTAMALELRKNGFETLSGYKLNTGEGFDEVEDRRLWDLKVDKDTYTHYEISGIFRKNVIINSIPTSVQVIDLQTNQVIGVTGKSRGVSLPVGRHELAFKKNGFITKKLSVNIDETFTDNIEVVLSRRVMFTAVDELGSLNTDIGANLISLKRNNRETLRASRRTPVTLIIPAYAYSVVFAKTGYQRAQVSIDPATTSVQVEMEALKSVIEIEVFDALTDQALTDTEIYYNFEGSTRTEEILLDRTDINGSAFGQLSGGSYVFTVRETGYREQSKVATARAGETLLLVFEIYPSN